MRTVPRQVGQGHAGGAAAARAQAQAHGLESRGRGSSGVYGAPRNPSPASRQPSPMPGRVVGSCGLEHVLACV